MTPTEHLKAALAGLQAEWDAMPEGFLRTREQTERMQDISRTMSHIERALEA